MKKPLEHVYGPDWSQRNGPGAKTAMTRAERDGKANCHRAPSAGRAEAMASTPELWETAGARAPHDNPHNKASGARALPLQS